MFACRKLVALGALAISAVAVTAPAHADQPTGSESPGCSATAPTTARFVTTLRVGRLTRTALVNLPPGQAAGARLPVILVFHAAGSNGPAAELQTGMTSLDNRSGFITVYPNSTSHYWSLGGPRDVDFTRALLDWLDDTLCVDDSRIYATGVSNGASLVSRLGCLLSNRLAAIAPVAGDDRVSPGCQPSRPVSVLEIHGSDDGSVSYGGAGGFGGGVWAFLGAWGVWDRCPTTPVAWRRIAPRVLYAVKSGCGAGTVIAHVKLLHEPHAWPSLVSSSHGSTNGSTNVSFSARTAVSQFFTTGTLSAPPAAARHP